MRSTIFTSAIAAYVFGVSSVAAWGSTGLSSSTRAAATGSPAPYSNGTAPAVYSSGSAPRVSTQTFASYTTVVTISTKPTTTAAPVVVTPSVVVVPGVPSSTAGTPAKPSLVTVGAASSLKVSGLALAAVAAAALAL